MLEEKYAANVAHNTRSVYYTGKNSYEWTNIALYYLRIDDASMFF